MYDARGSIIADVTESGTKEYRYAPYGNLLTENGTQAQEGAAGETESGDFYGYNGEAYHGDLGMIYLRARWYDPEQMRFSQKDIVEGVTEEPQSLNRYAYACDNPVSYADPSGELWTPTLPRRNPISFKSPAKQMPGFGRPVRRTTSASTGRRSTARAKSTGKAKSSTVRRADPKSAYNNTTKAAAKKTAGTGKTAVRPSAVKRTVAGSGTKKRRPEDGPHCRFHPAGI